MHEYEMAWMLVQSEGVPRCVVSLCEQLWQTAYAGMRHSPEEALLLLQARKSPGSPASRAHPCLWMERREIGCTGPKGENYLAVVSANMRLDSIPNQA